MSSDGQHATRAAVDNSEWDGNAAMTACKSASDYRAICAGRRDGDPELRSTWALPHHSQPGAPPNAAGVRNSLSRLPQTEGLVNREEAQRHLDRHMSTIQAQSDAADAAAHRAEHFASHAQTEAPAGAARLQPFPALLEVRGQVERGGKKLHHVHGTATAYEQLYEMWDAFGPYQEGVRSTAGSASLARKPDVAFLENHRGITMARTTNGTLELAELPTGLDYDAYLNAERQDVRDLLSAIDDELITESSFAFWITDGEWNEDYTQFWIKAYDIHRGDVSAVNYGANPYTSVAARAHEVLADLDHLPVGAARAAMARLQRRTDLPDLAAVGSQTPMATDSQPPAPQGRSVALVTSLLLVDDDE